MCERVRWIKVAYHRTVVCVNMFLNVPLKACDLLAICLTTKRKTLHHAVICLSSVITAC
jgi:hypothetical protein